MTIYRSFATGEVSPALYGRVDVDRWRSALNTCRNFITQPEGGLKSRQGVAMVANLGAVTQPRMVNFEFGPDDSCVLLLDGTTMKIVKDGVQVTGDHVIYSCSLVKPGGLWEVTTPYNHGYATGNTVQIIDGSSYAITVTGATTFTLDGTAGAGATSTVALRRTGGTSATSLPFAIDIDEIRWVQSGDTIYFTDGVNAPKKLVRNSHTGVSRELSWEVSNAPMYPTITEVASLSISGTAGTAQCRYRVTYTDKEGNESACLRGVTTTGTVGGTTPWTITSAAHGLQTNDTIEITEDKNDSAGKLVYRAGDLIRVVSTGANTFTVTGSPTGVSGTGNFKYRRTQATALLTTAASGSPITVTWTAVTQAETYNIFKEFGRVFGYIGSTSGTTFVDTGIVPDQKDVPVIGTDPGKGGKVPTAVGLFQQRLMLGGYSDNTERVVGSHIGNYSAFDPGAEDASGLDFELAGRTVSAIQHMLEIAGRSVVLTSTAEWTLKGGNTGGLTPTAINARVDSYHGSSSIVPALVGSSLLYVQKGDKIVRDARYDYSQEALASRDLTLWAKHLFSPGLLRVSYQRSAGIVWCLRTDGVLLGLTYNPEQEVWGWHRHDITGRTVEDITCVSEDNQDRLYLLTSTTAGLRVCRLPLDWTSGVVDDHMGFDECLTYDGRNLLGNYTMTLTGGSAWTTAETLTCTASGSAFVVGDVGKVLALTLGSSTVQVTITAYTSGTVVSVVPRSIVPTALRSVAASYAVCSQTFTGASHLNGETVGVIADGSREADAVVSGGSVTLSRPFARVQIGLPITATVKTLPLEASNIDTLLGDVRHITKVVLLVHETRGAKVGLSADYLEPMFTEYVDPVINQAPALQSGPREILVGAEHTDQGQIIIQQDNGLPTTILNARVLFNAGTEP